MNVEQQLEEIRVKYLAQAEALKSDIAANVKLRGPERWLNVSAAEHILKIQEDMVFLAWVLKRMLQNFQVEDGGS
jgi:hypothetical protein